MLGERHSLEHSSIDWHFGNFTSGALHSPAAPAIFQVYPFPLRSNNKSRMSCEPWYRHQDSEFDYYRRID